MRQVEFRMENGLTHRAIVEDSMALDLQERWGQARHNHHETPFRNHEFPMYLVSGYIFSNELPYHHEDNVAMAGVMQIDLSEVQVLVEFDNEDFSS